MFEPTNLSEMTEMFELLHPGVAGDTPHGSAVIDPLEKLDVGDDGEIGSAEEPMQDESESDELDYERDFDDEGYPTADCWELNDAPGDRPATSVADNWRCSMSDDDFDFNLNFNFHTKAVLPATGDDEGYKWGEPVGRDPYLWGEITLSGAPDYLNGEPLTGGRLTIECCWEYDGKYVDYYEFEVRIEGGVYGSPLDHIRDHPECVRFADQWSYPPADIVVRAIDAKRRRDSESLRKVGCQDGLNTI